MGAVGALLAAGAAPNVGGMLGLGQRTPLSLACGHCYTKDAKVLESIVQRLLAAGADPSCLSVFTLNAFASTHPGAGRLLLGALQRQSETSSFPMPADAMHAHALMCAAAAADAAEALQHFAARLLPDQRIAELAEAVLCAAAQASSMHVLQLAQQAAATPASQRTTVAASWLGRHFDSSAPVMLMLAARCRQTAVVQLLMDAGQPATNTAVCSAVRGGCAAMLEVLLTHGAPAVPATIQLRPGDFLQLPSVTDHDYELAPYSCPLLAGFQLRTAQVGLMQPAAVNCGSSPVALNHPLKWVSSFPAAGRSSCAEPARGLPPAGGCGGGRAVCCCALSLCALCS